MKHSEGFLAVVNDAKTRVRELSVEDVRALQEKGDVFSLVDCREESEWAKGHIVGAEYLGKGVFERDAEEKYPDKKQKIVIYCGGGFRSALVCDNLQKMGYENVFSMDGGWRGWNEKKYPTE